MKTIIGLFACLAFSLLAMMHNAMAQPPNSNHIKKYPIGELVKLPHPGKVVVQYEKEIGITEAQKDRLNKEIRAVFGRQIMAHKKEIYALEVKAKEMILSNGDKQEISEILDQITLLKRELVEIRIRFYANCKKILTSDQWDHVLAYLRDGTLPGEAK